jgi:hypothetical protein
MRTALAAALAATTQRITGFPLLCRVSDAGQRQWCDIDQWPASESRQGRNPRGMGRGECRALRCGDLAGAEGVSAGARCRSRRLVTPKTFGFSGLSANNGRSERCTREDDKRGAFIFISSQKRKSF